MTIYTVRAKRWPYGWELHIDGVGVTQSRNLDRAERMVRDYIETLTDHDTSSDQVVITPIVGDGLDEAVQAARDAVTEADRERRKAAAQVRQVVRDMKQAGLSGRDIAHLLNVSPQRVSQLLKAHAGSGGRPHSLTVMEGFQDHDESGRDDETGRPRYDDPELDELSRLLWPLRFDDKGQVLSDAVMRDVIAFKVAERVAKRVEERGRSRKWA